MRVRLWIVLVAMTILVAATVAGAGPKVPAASSSDRALLAAIEARIDPGRRVPLAPLSDIYGRMAAGQMAGLDDDFGSPSAPGWPNEISGRANYSKAWLSAGGPESLEPLPSAMPTRVARERLGALVASCMAANALADEIKDPAIKARALSMIAKRLGEIAIDVRPTLDLSINPEPRRDPDGNYEKMWKQASDAAVQGFTSALDQANAAYGYAFAKSLRRDLQPQVDAAVKAVSDAWSAAELALEPKTMRPLSKAAHAESIAALSSAARDILDKLEADVAKAATAQIAAAVDAAAKSIDTDTQGGVSLREAVAAADAAFSSTFKSGLDDLRTSVNDLVTTAASDLAQAIPTAVDGPFADLSASIQAEAAKGVVVTDVLAVARERLDATADIASGLQESLPAAVTSSVIDGAVEAAVARRGETTTALAQDAACLAAYAMTTYMPTDLGFHVSTPAKLEADWAALSQAIPPILDAVEAAMVQSTPCAREGALAAPASPVAPGMVGRPATGPNDLARNLAFADPARAMALAGAYAPRTAPLVANYVKGIGMSAPAVPAGAALDRYVRGMPTSVPAHLARARQLLSAGNWHRTEWGSVLRGDLIALAVRSAEVCLALDPGCDAARDLIARAKGLLDHDVPTYASDRGLMPDY